MDNWKTSSIASLMYTRVWLRIICIYIYMCMIVGGFTTNKPVNTENIEILLPPAGINVNTVPVLRLLLGPRDP